MINRFLLLVAIAVSMNSYADEMENPLKVSFCDVTENPKLYSGKIIEVEAKQLKLKKYEWGIIGDTCLPDEILLIFPEDINPKPQFILEKTDALNELLTSRNEPRVSIRANFIGRFDCARTDKRKRFGKSKKNMRLILLSVSNPIKFILPYK